jgi:ankyrin repeat protein
LLASEDGQPAVAEYLLTHGAAVSERDDEGRNALMRAAVGGHPGICSLLISKGAKPNALQAKTGMTALHWAAKNGRVAAVKELLGGGASRDIVDKNAKKAVDYARLSGDPECISLLSIDIPGRKPST